MGLVEFCVGIMLCLAVPYWIIGYIYCSIDKGWSYKHLIIILFALFIAGSFLVEFNRNQVRDWFPVEKVDGSLL